MTDAALTVLLTGLVVSVVANLWQANRNDRLHDALDDERREHAATMRDLRVAGGSKRIPARRLEPPCAGFDHEWTGPTGAELALWDMEVDGLPWRTWMFGMPTMDTESDPERYLPKVAPPRRVNETLERVYRRITTGEVREIVGVER